MQRFRPVILAALIVLGASMATAPSVQAVSSAGRPEMWVAAAHSPAAYLPVRHSPVEEMPATLRDGTRPDPTAGFLGRLNPLEEGLFADAADKRLDRHTLLQAALIASGVEDEETLQHYVELVGALAWELKQTEKLSGSPRQQAEAVFDFLHRRILHQGYRLEATDLRKALDEGWFNCVSASVLYNCLAAECGLTAYGLESPGHAMSRVLLPEGAIDVETTCPRWFRLIGDPKRQAEHVAKTLGRSPSRDTAHFREVSAIELASMIYYNRGVDLLSGKRFAEAAAANAKAVRLDPSSKTARGNLLATINNWAIVEGASQRFDTALELLRRGMAIDPSYDVLRLNYIHVCRQCSLSLCTSRDYERAIATLRAASEGLPDARPIRETISDVYRQWARSLFDLGQVDEGFAVLQQARADLGETAEALAAEAVEPGRWNDVRDAQPRMQATGQMAPESAMQTHDAAILDGSRRGSRRWISEPETPEPADGDTRDRARDVP